MARVARGIIIFRFSTVRDENTRHDIKFPALNPLIQNNRINYDAIRCVPQGGGEAALISLDLGVEWYKF